MYKNYTILTVLLQLVSHGEKIMKKGSDFVMFYNNGSEVDGEGGIRT